MILDKIQHIWQSMLGAALPFGIVKWGRVCTPC
jgi:hypothetical protein